MSSSKPLRLAEPDEEGREEEVDLGVEHKGRLEEGGRGGAHTRETGAGAGTEGRREGREGGGALE